MCFGFCHVMLKTHVSLITLSCNLLKTNALGKLSALGPPCLPQRSFQILLDPPDCPGSTQAHTDPPKSIQIHPDPLRLIQMHPDPPRSMQIHPDTPECIQIQPDQPRFINPPRPIYLLNPEQQKFHILHYEIAAAAAGGRRPTTGQGQPKTLHSIYNILLRPTTFYYVLHHVCAWHSDVSLRFTMFYHMFGN